MNVQPILASAIKIQLAYKLRFFISLREHTIYDRDHLFTLDFIWDP